MKLPSLHTLWQGITHVVIRFPLQFLIAIVSTSIWWYLIDYRIDNQVLENNLGTLLAICNLALTLLLASDLYCESHQVSNLWKWMFRAVDLIISIALFFVLEPWAYISDIYRIALLAFAFHLLVAFAPYIKKKNLNGFWQYNKTLFLRFLTSAFYAAVLYAGLAIALFAINGLFNVEIEYKAYLKLFALVSAGFTNVFFLAGIPNNFQSLEEDESYPKGLKIFTQYVLIPLMTIYLAILLVYEAKIILQWTLPKGLVSTLILGYAVFGILSLLLIHPIKEKEGNGWIKLFSKFFYLMMIPLVVLLLLAIGKRVGNYGITESRYILLVLAIWLAAITVYFLFVKKQNIKIIPISLCVIAILATYGPQSAFSISKFSQIARLKKLSESKAKEDKKDIPSIVRYLVQKHGLASIQPFTKTNVAALEAKMNATAAKNNDNGYALKSKKVDTAFALMKVRNDDDYSYNYVRFVNDNKGMILINGYDAIFSFASYNSDSVKRFDGNTFKVQQSPYDAAVKDKNKLILTIGSNEVLHFDIQKVVDSAYEAYKKDKLNKEGFDGYVYPSAKMELIQTSKKYTFKVLITNMTGSYDNTNNRFDRFDLDGFLLIKKN